MIKKVCQMVKMYIFKKNYTPNEFYKEVRSK